MRRLNKAVALLPNRLKVALFRGQIVRKAFLIPLLLAAALMGQAQKKMDHILIRHIKHDFEIAGFDSRNWRRAKAVEIQTYWSGEMAPTTRSFSARLLWSDTALYVRFDAEQHERLVVSEKPDLTRKVKGLWDRDVCEIFIAPDHTNPNKYFEFEVAPTGEWIDLDIEVTPVKRLTAWDYTSGMEAAARVRKKDVVEVIKIPFKALGRSPRVGEIWRGNLFRCIGAGRTRGYLAWRPTHTKEPGFHVPSAFGEFEFK
jgi:hypothetical protein